MTVKCRNGPKVRLKCFQGVINVVKEQKCVLCGRHEVSINQLTSEVVYYVERMK